MIFQQIFEPVTSTFTYLVGDEESRECLLIDTVLEEVERYAALLGDLGLRLVHVLDTHVHADHVTAAGALRKRFGARTAIHRAAGVGCADVALVEGDVLRAGRLELRVLETPGHTSSDVCYLMSDRVFTGDTLFIGGCGRTDFQGGSAERLWESVQTKLFTLPGETLVYPGHDYRGNTVSTIAREKAENPRLGGGRTRESFVALMANLDLPMPRDIDRAVPANRACGQVAVPQG